MSSLEIFFASDDNYAKHLLVAINSIIINSDKEDINFYILDGGISDFYKAKIKSLAGNVEFITIDEEYLKKIPNSKGLSFWSKQMYFRYFIPKIKPNLKKALYLDCDVVILSSLKELWDTNLEDKYCAVVKDYNSKYSIGSAANLGLKNYFNSGVILINNEKWVNENVTDMLICATNHLFKENKLIFPDQDSMNYAFRENVIFLNPKFNLQANADSKIFKEINEPVIVHYNGGDKPWGKGYEFYPDAYLKSLYMVGFKKEYFLIKLNHMFWKIIHTVFSVKNKYVNKQKYKVFKILGFTIKRKM